MLLFENMLFLSWEWMYNWHPAHPAHVSEFECLSLGSSLGRKVTKKRV